MLPTPEQTAASLLRLALEADPVSEVYPGTTAMNAARMLSATRLFTSCPSCGAEPWCNIDCDTCTVMSILEKDADHG